MDTFLPLRIGTFQWYIGNGGDNGSAGLSWEFALLVEEEGHNSLLQKVALETGLQNPEEAPKSCK